MRCVVIHFNWGRRQRGGARYTSTLARACRLNQVAMSQAEVGWARRRQQQQQAAAEAAAAAAAAAAAEDAVFVRGFLNCLAAEI